MILSEVRIAHPVPSGLILMSEAQNVKVVLSIQVLFLLMQQELKPVFVMQGIMVQPVNAEPVETGQHLTEEHLPVPVPKTVLHGRVTQTPVKQPVHLPVVQGHIGTVLFVKIVRTAIRPKTVPTV